MYAIIATGGKQYKVAEGDIIRVEKLGVEEGESVTFDQVLAVSDDGALKVAGDVAGASGTATVLRNAKASFTSIRERPAITKRTATGSSIHRFGSKRSTHNQVDHYD